MSSKQSSAVAGAVKIFFCVAERQLRCRSIAYCQAIALLEEGTRVMMSDHNGVYVQRPMGPWSHLMCIPPIVSLVWTIAVF